MSEQSVLRLTNLKSSNAYMIENKRANARQGQIQISANFKPQI